MMWVVIRIEAIQISTSRKYFVENKKVSIFCLKEKETKKKKKKKKQVASFEEIEKLSMF